jgi:CubicO group peptidase (beta-lactamase class C family)
MDGTFPGKEWETRLPAELGFSAEKLGGVEKWLRASNRDATFRVVIARDGYLAAEWNQGADADEQMGQASVSKSYFSCMLGIAVEQGKVPSPDAKVMDYYPEMMDIGEDEGPKPGRYPFEKDRDITFRQLICNTSGYMKPGENPGEVFHYQTFGMNLLTNSLATIYGLYDSADPDRLPGCGKLIEDHIRDPIGGTWSHSYTDFDHPPQAKKNIFGHSLRVVATARDTARAGHLWLNWGNWNGVQVIPETYLKEATVTNPFILKHEPEENWKYGHGFWVNDHGKHWADLPRDSFAASGAGAKHVWVCPRLGLVVSQNPGTWNDVKEEDAKVGIQNEVLARILDSLVE